jgi:AbrB family looped-hinge helix DNA binding protein
MSSAKVKVSPKFQIVIPKEVREELAIKAGEELLMYTMDGAIHVAPRRSIKDLRGIAKGIRWEHSDRDHTERF